MKKKRIITICAVALVILTASAFYLNRAVIFQRGNPIPYLISAVQISEKNPYVAVDETKDPNVENVLNYSITSARKQGWNLLSRLAVDTYLLTESEMM